MSALTWKPAGKGVYLGIDWAALPQAALFDAYVCWHDFTGSLWSRCGRQQTRVIVELTNPLDETTAAYLNGIGLRVTPNYNTSWAASKYITGVCLNGSSLKRFCEAVFAGSDLWVARYEVSEGFVNPDAVIDPAGNAQQWGLVKPKALGGALIGFIDYGCAFANTQFLDDSCRARIEALWDQQANFREGPPPYKHPLDWQDDSTRYAYGRTVYGDALKKYVKQFTTVDQSGKLKVVDEASCYRFAQYEPVLRSATHGTHIMDIATGHPPPLRHLSPKPPRPSNPGAKPPKPHDAAITFVQLPRYRDGAQIAGLLKAHVLDAVTFITSLRATASPAFINLSYGSYCGPHDGTSILELALDDLITRGKGRLHIVVPAGNASQLSGHAQALVGSLQSQTLSWYNLADDPSESFVELWVPDKARVRVRASFPGQPLSASPWVTQDKVLRLDNGGNTVALLAYASRPCQTVADYGSMILFATTATAGAAAAPHGSWSIEVENLGSSPVLIDAWCERDDPVFGTEGGPRQSRFESHVERTGTLNSIAHGRNTVVVGGYDVHSGSTVQAPGPVSAVSSSGPGRLLSGRLRHRPDNDRNAKDGPEVLGPCSLGLADPGLPGAAVHSGDQLRLLGTSVAAAAYTRWLVVKTLPPSPPLPKGATKNAGEAAPASAMSPALREPHPDDDQDIPRIP